MTKPRKWCPRCKIQIYSTGVFGVRHCNECRVSFTTATALSKQPEAQIDYTETGSEAMKVIKRGTDVSNYQLFKDNMIATQGPFTVQELFVLSGVVKDEMEYRELCDTKLTIDGVNALMRFYQDDDSNVKRGLGKLILQRDKTFGTGAIVMIVDWQDEKKTTH